jgi:Cu(I)/Ag(I) efflux system membrane protein CusA/SilA
VGGIVVMRYGQNALKVINGIKERLDEVRKTLPPGVEIVSGYDRAGLIKDSIDTLKRDLLEEAAIVSLIIIVFLFHFRSALIPILTLPLAVLATFIPMYYFQVSSNIMSLGGLALAIGVLVDASIVMVENGYRHLSERQAEAEKGRENGKRRGAPNPPLIRGQAGWPSVVLLADYHRRFITPRLPSRSSGRSDVSATC